MADTNILSEERQYFDESIAEWLTQYQGRVIVVKGREVFDTEEEALAAGARKFGLESFLMRRVQQRQDEVKAPALTLGLLSANINQTAWITNA